MMKEALKAFALIYVEMEPGDALFFYIAIYYTEVIKIIATNADGRWLQVLIKDSTIQGTIVFCWDLTFYYI